MKIRVAVPIAVAALFMGSTAAFASSHIAIPESAPSADTVKTAVPEPTETESDEPTASETPAVEVTESETPEARATESETPEATKSAEPRATRSHDDSTDDGDDAVGSDHEDGDHSTASPTSGHDDSTDEADDSSDHSGDSHGGDDSSEPNDD
jgi:methionine-rich copper-binding protein CopC